MQKYLPIKFYQKREKNDDRFTRAAGGDALPSWVLSGEELAARSSSLVKEVDEIIEVLNRRNSKEYNYIPVVAAVSIEDDAIAKSHRESITDFFGDERKHSRAIGFSGENEILFRIDSLSEMRLVQQKLGNVQSYAKGISAITHISPYAPVIDKFKVDYPETILKATLLNYYDVDLNNRVKDAFTALCDSLSVESRESFYSKDLIIYRLCGIDSEEQYCALCEFPALQFIEPMPRIRIGASLDNLTQEVDVAIPEEDVDYPVVGILDGGISKIEHLKPWIDGRTTPYPEEYLDKTHGTFIGGIVVYGDKLEGKTITGVNGAKVYDGIVMPDTTKETFNEDDFITNIRECVRKNPSIKIWSLSIGYESLEISDSTFSQLAIALDEIQQEYGIIICKAGGNCDNFRVGKPVGRITVPAESLLSVTVGAISNDEKPSCFSRIGPGTANTIKPELVSYGGDYVLHSGRYLLDGVKSFSPDGRIYESAGTSYSTPRVATILASLQNEICETFNPLLIKALSVHSATYPGGDTLNQADRVKMMGYGVPAPVRDILFNAIHEITMVQSDRLAKGKYIEILEFPFPECLVNEEGYYYGDITVTLVAAPVLNGSQGAEYCQSDIEVKFGTFDSINNMVATPRQKNEYGPDGFSNLLLPRLYHSYADTNVDEDNPFMRERTLLNYGKKYQPVKKWHVNLEEVTPANKNKCLLAPKKWCLRLTGLYRDFTSTRAALDDVELHQDFTLVITIKDPKGEKPVYDEVTQLLDTRNFIHNDIRLRDNIKERIAL